MRERTASEFIERAPELPRPEIGYCVLERKKVRQIRERGIIIPNREQIANRMGSAATPDDERPYYRLIMRATSGGYYAGNTWVEHSAKPGDAVLLGPGVVPVEYPIDPRWPADHICVSLAHIPMTYPARESEPSEGAAS